MPCHIPSRIGDSYISMDRVRGRGMKAVKMKRKHMHANRLLSLKSRIKYKYLRRHIVRISPRHRIMYLEERNNTATPSGLKARRWTIYISGRFSERGWTKCYIVWPRPRGTNVMKNWQTSPSKVDIKIQDKIRIRTHNRAWLWFIFIDIARWHGSPEESSLIFFSSFFS